MSEKNHENDSGAPGESAPAWMDGLLPEPEPEPEPEVELAPAVEDEPETPVAPLRPAAPSAAPTVPQRRVVAAEAPVVEDTTVAAVDPVSGVSKRTQKRVTWVLVGAGVAVFVAVFGAIGVKAFGGAGSEQGPASLDAQLAATSAAQAPTQSTSPTAAPAAASAFSCPEKSSGGEVTGAGPGDRASVAGVVLAFNDAYYQARDAKKALSLMAPESPLKDAGAMQKAIDEMPEGTKHCVTVRTDGDNASVELTEARPNTAPAEIGQKVTTRREGDQVSIVDVTAEG